LSTPQTQTLNNKGYDSGMRLDIDDDMPTKVIVLSNIKDDGRTEVISPGTDQSS